MNPEEVKEQIEEMFEQVPMNLLNNIKGFIIILHGDDGCAVNMSNALLSASFDEKITIVTHLLRKLGDSPSMLIERLSRGF
jgi:hypothetical protein